MTTVLSDIPVDTVVTLDVSANVVQTTQIPDAIVETVADTSVVTNSAVDTVVATAQDISVVTTDSSPAIVLTVETQGPVGPPGPDGTPIASYIADIDLSGQRVVRPITSGRVNYADSGTVAHANSVVGMTVGAAAANAAVGVQFGGLIVEPTWNWIVNQPVFCGLNGALTQTPPVTGFQLVIGVAATPTSISIGIKQPIIIQ